LLLQPRLHDSKGVSLEIGSSLRSLLPTAMEDSDRSFSTPPGNDRLGQSPFERSPGSLLSPLNEDQGYAQPLEETFYESPDAWGEGSPGRSAASSTAGSPWRSNNFSSKLRESRSLPTLHGTWYSHSPHSNTWYSSADNHTISSPSKTMWSPLGSTWRDREKDDHGVLVRKNADEGCAFINGCIPNWGKMHVRKIKTLERELTWSYYRTCRHALHPHREPVGDPHMPNECVVEQMRGGYQFKFQFWRDLKPPFMVNSVKRDEEDACTKHPDGDLYYVSYACGIDYVGERLWNTSGEGGTFENKIKGVATVRIPDGFPAQRHIVIENWGRPTLNGDSQTDPKGAPMGASYIDPNKWMPISQELGLRSDMARFGKCRHATHQAHAGEKARRSAEVDPLQKLLLGPHATLPQLAATNGKNLPSTPKKSASKGSPSKGSSVEGATPSPKKKREHRIFTAAAGFIRYNG